MQAIIPIFIDSERSFWGTTEFETVLNVFFQKITASKQIEKTMVFTNDGYIADLSEKQGIGSHLIREGEMQTPSDLLPLGTLPSIQYLKKTRQIDSDGLVVFGFKNPLITSELIDKAIQEYNRSGASVLMSVRKPLDHPCQLNSCYKIVDMNYIYFFEDEEQTVPYVQAIQGVYSCRLSLDRAIEPFQSGEYLVDHPKDIILTRPFHFNWTARWIEKESQTGTYVRKDDEAGCAYVPIEQHAKDFPLETPSRLWVKKDAGTAALLLTRSRPISLPRVMIWKDRMLRIIGASIPGDGLIFFVCSDPRGECYLWVRNADKTCCPPYCIRLSRFDLHRTMEKEWIRIETDDLSDPVHIPALDGTECGLACSLLSLAADDYYDVSEPFTPAGDLWDPKNHVNQMTGEQITGRQHFPDVYEPDGTMFILKSHTEQSIREAIMRGNAYGFPIPDENSIQIESRIGFLKYLAIRRAQGACLTN